MEEHRRWKWRVLCLHYRAQFVYRKKTARVYAYQGLMACWNGVLGEKENRTSSWDEPSQGERKKMKGSHMISGRATGSVSVVRIISATEKRTRIIRHTINSTAVLTSESSTLQYWVTWKTEEIGSRSRAL